MSTKTYPTILGLIVIGSMLAAYAQEQDTNTSPQTALTGEVRSQEEGPMEGVLVTVRQEGASFTVTVVSDDQGRYSFPPDRLEPGPYSVSIRAVGYELPDPGQVIVDTQKTT